MKTLMASAALLLCCAHAQANVSVQLNFVNEKGVATTAGTVEITESKYGLVFTPKLSGLPAGLHGFHVHENPSCAAAEAAGKTTPAGAAGGHLDPSASKKHGTPWGEGHLGDLPALYVDGSGNAAHPVLAPRLKLADVRKRALMVHAGGDNHADHPAALGGGGARMACGVIQ